MGLEFTFNKHLKETDGVKIVRQDKNGNRVRILVLKKCQKTVKI